MDRRTFLKMCFWTGVAFRFETSRAMAGGWMGEKRKGIPPGMLLIDAHAHPDQFYYLGPREGPAWENWWAQYGDPSSTLDKIRQLPMQGSGFAALGDTQQGPLTWGQVLAQLHKVMELEEEGLVRIVRRHNDILPKHPAKNHIPGALLSLEGATPLGNEGTTVFSRLEAFYRCGGRMITLMHYLDNPFGQAMKKDRPREEGDGLTVLGRKAVERMLELGIIVDTAHAHYPTLRDMVDIAKVNGLPVIDSHTGLSPCNEFCGGRLRTWEEMEMIAETGGLVCTWPLKWSSPNHHASRETLQDWALENLRIAQRLGIAHVGLGTDGGGMLPEMVDGYESILDLPDLVEAMAEVGFTRKEIAAYMGGNLLRLLRKCLG